MPDPVLYAPWRIDYIRSLDKTEQEPCFICAASAAKDPEEIRQRLVLWSTDLSIVIINQFPYTNGHLLVAPRSHTANLEDLTDDQAADLQRQTIQCVKLLKRVFSPQGFNIGTNLGRCAGAGLPGHLHQHVVPRWAGDTNFMSVVGEVRIVPQAMTQLFKELIEAKAEMAAR